MNVSTLKAPNLKSPSMSLRKYLRTRLLLLALIVIIPFSFMIFFLYELGLDDATEQYLQQDLKQAIFVLNKQHVLPVSSEHKKFFLGHETLPSIYQTQASIMADAPYIYVRDTQFVYYGLRGRWQGQFLYVFHVFPVNEHIEGLQLESMTAIAAGLIFFIMLLGAWALYRRISLAMLSMQSVVGDIDSVKGAASINFEFTEVSEIAQHLLDAMEALEQKTLQEKQFIQSLSHELRTPMAIIQLAVEVLNKRQLGAKNQDKLDAIFNANQNMMSLANQLLGLWADEPQAQVSRLDIKQVVLDSMDALGDQYSCRARFKLECPEDQICLQGSDLAMQLIIMNLLKNAVIHGQGPIEVSLTQSQLMIKNTPLNEHQIKPEDSVGMGLLVVQRALAALGWHSVVNEEAYYQVTLYFKLD
jgi:signal transduction histidine kinase